MSYIPEALRRLVYERAGGHCEYCLLDVRYAYFPYEIDHIVAEKHGGKTEAGKEDLNKELSELRAMELIKQLTSMFKQKVSEIKNIDQLSVEYIGQGRGEEYPIPTIKDYKDDDDRRRIVLCYWAVLPNIQ